MDEITVPKIKSVSKPPDPEKEFLNKFRLFFSSLTARSTQYAYFNIAKNTIVLCNSTSPPPNLTHGDKIMQYGIGELTYHFVEFKDIEFFNEVYRFLQIPKETVYCIHILNVVSILNKLARKELNVFDNEYGEKVLLSKGRKTYDKKNVVGMPIYNFHITSMLSQWYGKVLTIGTLEHQKQFPFVEMPVDPDVKLTGRVFFIPVNTALFTDSAGQPVFKDSRPEMKILGLDGLSCASIKEFYRKIMSQPHRFIFYFWAVDNSYVSTMSIFENETAIVRSIRPNVLAIPISKTTVMEINNLLELSEESHE